MPTQIRIPTPLRKLTNEEEVVETAAENVGAAIDDLDSRFPGIRERLLDDEGEVLDIGRRRRFHTRAQRIAIAQRDKHCQWTGCDAPPSRCHVHHLIPWARGGGTSVEQGRLYFPRHHHKVHELMEQSIRQQT